MKMKCGKAFMGRGEEGKLTLGFVEILLSKACCKFIRRFLNRIYITSESLEGKTRIKLNCSIF